jgi:oligopeptide transport system substrate-binding protein
MSFPGRKASLLVVLGLIIGCGGPDAPRERKSPSGKYYGGVFSANESEELRSLFPLSLQQAAAHRIGAQIYEGLVRMNPQDLSIVPGLAEYWAVDPSGLSYTFTLREGVRFHDADCFPDGKGRLLTAADVALCLTRICTQDAENFMFWLLQDRVVGANAHYASGAPATEPVKGISVPDERTVRIDLTAPWPGFLHVLAHQGCWVYPSEAFEQYGADARWRPVGTGPFRVKSFDRGDAMVMERWPHYWGTDADGATLPYLDAVRYTFEPDKEKELEAFLNGALSVVYELPVGRTDAMRPDAGYTVQMASALSIQFYGLNTRKPPFDNPLVRRAFALAIDRQALVDSVLDGLALVADHGAVAPGLSGYPYELVRGLHFDPVEARRLLAEAGYEGGKGLPTVHLQVNNNGFGYVKVAEAAQNMLERELGARVITSVLPAEQHFQRVEKGEPLLWREGWICDHPDPENFLALFYGRNAPADTSEPSFLNSTRHRDARFDSLFALAGRTSEPSERMRLLALAEDRLMENLPFIPLYHERSVRLVQPWVKDFPINGMEYRDLRTVWMEPHGNR